MTNADFTSTEQSDEIRIDQMQKSDVDAVHKFILGDFLKFEPMNAAIARRSRRSASQLLGKGRRRTSGGRRSRLHYSSSLRQRREWRRERFQARRKEHFKVREIKRIIFELESKIWSLVPPEVNSILYWIIVSVDGNFKRRGIARKLVTHNLDVPKRMGCQGIITEASAFNSQQLFAKLGYRTLAEIHHKDWRSDAGGRIFNCSDGTEKIVLTYKAF